MKINEAIRKMMEKREFRNVDLADKMEVRPQAIYNYLNGQRVNGVLKPMSVTVDTALEIADALEYRVVLMPWKDTRNLDEDKCFIVDERLSPKRSKRSSKNSEK